MDLKKYLNNTYYNLVINQYDFDYLSSLNEDNFLKIYKLFEKYGFYYIEDIILKYIEIFEMNSVYVEKEILKLKEKLGDLYIYIIGNDLTYLNEIIDNQEFEDD